MEPIRVPCADGSEVQRLLGEGNFIKSFGYDDQAGSYYFNIAKLDDAGDFLVSMPPVYWAGAGRRNLSIYPPSIYGLGLDNSVGLADPGWFTRLMPVVSGAGGGEDTANSPDSSPGGIPPSPPSSSPPTPPAHPPPPDSNLIGTLLGAIKDDEERSRAAKDYLEHLKWQENWRIMPEAVLLDGIRDKSIGIADLEMEIIRSKIGTPNGRYREFLEQVVETAKEVRSQTRTWGKLAWPAFFLLLASVGTSLYFTYKGFQMVADGKLRGYELIILIFVLALVAVSPAVLLLLQRPLKGVDQWSPSSLKVSDREDSGSGTGKS